MDFIELFGHRQKIRKVGAAEVLFKEGDSGSETFVVLEGAAEIWIGKTMVELARPGGIVGEMALVDDDHRRSATVISRTPCQLVVLSQSDFDRLIRERPDFARYVLKAVVERLRHMNDNFLAGASSSGPGK